VKAPSAVSLLLRGGIVIAALALASCSSVPKIDVPKEVRLPVPIPCVDAAKRPKPPAVVPIDDLLAMDKGTRTLRAWANLERLVAYAAEVEAVVEGCSRIPTPEAPSMQKK